MESIRMEIAFTDLAYAQKLARRLCELCPGMQINVHIPERMENIPDCDVLLTEENSRPSNLPQTVRFVSLTPEERLRPAPWILDKILDACEGRCGKLFTSKMKTAVQTLLFLAATGGAGTTATALTLGRILAGASEQEVLYLEIDESHGSPAGGGWRWYTKITEPAFRPAAELSYRLRQQQRVRLQPYLAKDFYGLRCLSLPADAILKLQMLPDLLVGFGAVVVDCGTRADERLSGQRLYLINQADSRCNLWQPEITVAEDEIRVENRGSYYHAEERRFVLTNDPQSFVKRNEDSGREFVEIAQNGRFARDLRRMAEALFFFTNEM